MSRTLTPETATKLLLTHGTHAVTYTYAREISGSTPPYHLSCSVCGDLGWHRATLTTLIKLARAAHGFAYGLAPHRTSKTASQTPHQWLTPPDAPKPATALLAADPSPHASHALPPCALDSATDYAAALAWITEED